jgi:hypothetical protein
MFGTIFGVGIQLAEAKILDLPGMLSGKYLKKKPIHPDNSA